MIEIQIVPSDIRRSVRYVFFDRRRVTLGVAVFSVVLAALIGSMAAAPTVIRRVYKENVLGIERHEREIEHARLRENVTQMTSIEKNLEEHRIRVAKLMTVYGLDRSLGQGGFSFPFRVVNAEQDLDDARRRESSLRAAVSRLQQQLDLIANYEAANADLVRHTPSILPIPADQFVLTSPFGSRVSPFTHGGEFHKGLDLSAPTGTQIYAAADGTVSFAGRVALNQSVPWWRFGNVVVIRHSDHFLTIYGHCDTVTVHTGQEVKQGQTIATVGSTGWSTNSHLHYEIRNDLENAGTYVAVDPRIYILNYQWSNEAALLMRLRTGKDYKDFDPLPSVFVGKRRAS
jgi:murein DD-endopeptidase MepM/ murein hydrolase activator NlpD